MSYASDPVDFYVDDKKAYLISAENMNRTAINIWAGEFDLFWGGSRDLVPGGISGRIRAGENPVEIRLKGDIYVRRQDGEGGFCGFTEEFEEKLHNG